MRKLFKYLFGCLIGLMMGLGFHYSQMADMIEKSDKDKIIYAENGFAIGCKVSFMMGTGMPFVPPEFAAACDAEGYKYGDHLKAVQK